MKLIKRVIKHFIDLLEYLQARRTYRKNHMCWKHNCKKDEYSYSNGNDECPKCERDKNRRKLEKLERAKQRRGL